MIPPILGVGRIGYFTVLREENWIDDVIGGWGGGGKGGLLEFIIPTSDILEHWYYG